MKIYHRFLNRFCTGFNLDVIKGGSEFLIIQKKKKKKFFKTASKEAT